jgi:hypothetical protein
MQTRSKYRVRTDPAGVAERTFQGRTYASKAECRYAQELELLRLSGAIRSWDPQFPIPLEVNGLLVCKIVIDFRVQWKDGRTSLVEVKGHETPEYKLKRKLFRAVMGYDFEVVKV